MNFLTWTEIGLKSQPAELAEIIHITREKKTSQTPYNPSEGAWSHHQQCLSQSVSRTFTKLRFFIQIFTKLFNVWRRKCTSITCRNFSQFPSKMWEFSYTFLSNFLKLFQYNSKTEAVFHSTFQLQIASYCSNIIQPMFISTVLSAFKLERSSVCHGNRSAGIKSLSNNSTENRRLNESFTLVYRHEWATLAASQLLIAGCWAEWISTCQFVVYFVFVNFRSKQLYINRITDAYRDKNTQVKLGTPVWLRPHSKEE